MHLLHRFYGQIRLQPTMLVPTTKRNSLDRSFFLLTKGKKIHLELGVKRVPVMDSGLGTSCCRAAASQVAVDVSGVDV